MRIKLDCPYDFIDKEFINSLDISEDDPECIIVNPGIDETLGANYFSKYPNLKLIGTPSTGVNHIDDTYVKSKGIPVRSLLFDRDLLENIHASAEFTWIHIMNLVRKFSVSLQHVDKWRDRKNEQSLRSTELHGKTIGIIGLGRIGRKLSFMIPMSKVQH